MAALPDYVSLEQTSYSLQDASIIERSEVDRGPAKTRRTATDPMITLNGSIFFKSRADIAAFRAWFYSAAGANAGAAWFDWIDPRTETVRQIRFVSMGALTPLAGRFAIAQQPVVFEYLETVEQIAADAPRRWDFASTVEGWSGYAGFSPTPTWSDGAITVSASGPRAILESPVALSIAGGLYSRVRMSIKRTAGASWNGTLYYVTTGHAEVDGYMKQNPVNPLPSVGSTAIVEWDMSQLTAGASDWLASRIYSLRFDLGGSPADAFSIDWIEVGAP